MAVLIVAFIIAVRTDVISRIFETLHEYFDQLVILFTLSLVIWHFVFARNNILQYRERLRFLSVYGGSTTVSAKRTIGTMPSTPQAN